VKYRKKPETVDAITFSELVEYGRRQKGTSIVNNMPLSFDFKGRHVTHENDNCYIYGAFRGDITVGREEVLVFSDNGEISTCLIDTFKETHEKVEGGPK